MDRLGHSRRLLIASLCAALLVALTSCTVSLPASLTSTSTPSSCSSTSSSSCALGAGDTNLQLFTEPNDGVMPVTNSIRSAQKSVWVEVYELTNTSVISALEDAANQGRDVRVMLDPHPFGFSASSVQETLDKLKAAGVKTNTSNPAFEYTHAKFMIIDSTTLFLMTANLTKAALGGSKSAANREYLLNDPATADVQEAENIFKDDWSRITPTLSDANLIVSPVNARVKLLALINSAQSSLFIENEEMQDQQIEDALAQAAKRGVKVEVVLPAPGGGSDSNSAGVAFLRQANISVREDKQLYIHAKMMIVDLGKAYVGSENFSSTSLDNNRELGLIVAESSIIQSLETTFMSDYAASQ
jgi:phosphatidylserine/phosphatidylglycerophosphate/cardiolipin synthase-like enzyme